MINKLIKILKKEAISINEENEEYEDINDDDDSFSLITEDSGRKYIFH